MFRPPLHGTELIGFHQKWRAGGRQQLVKPLGKAPAKQARDPGRTGRNCFSGPTGKSGIPAFLPSLIGGLDLWFEDLKPWFL